MKLLFNTESLAPPLTGIGNYTLNLLENLKYYPSIERIDCFSGGRFREVDEVLAEIHAGPEVPAGLSAAGGGMRRLLRGFGAAYALREVFRGARFRMHSKRLRDFIYHEPSFILKPHAGISIATIHDLSFVYYPEFHPAARAKWLSEQLPRTLARADFLITDSERVRQELIADFSVPESRVRSIPLGAGEQFRPVSSEQALPILEKYALQHGRYVLFLGTIEPRKGVDTLLQAWKGLPAAVRASHTLVLAGSVGWHAEDLLTQIREMRDRYAVRHLDFVAASDLPALYSRASAFVFPAVYEGFGLPVLEAMRCKVPVICTAQTSMADFAGDAAITFERGCSEQLSASIEYLLGDAEACRQYAEAGLTRAGTFSWSNCAKDTFEVYRSLVG